MSSPASNRTAPGRAKFLSKFASDEERRSHMAAIGAAGNAARLVLNGDERAALTDALPELVTADPRWARLARRLLAPVEDGGAGSG